MSAIMTPPLAPPPHTVAAPPLYRISVAQYHAMAKHGILTPEDRVELIQGLLVTQMTKHPPHRISTILVRDYFQAASGPGWHVLSQDPITLSASEPEPDVALARGNVRDYSNRHPGPADVAIVVEVAESSHAYDRTTKKELYAAAKIPTYWIVNLMDNQIEVYTDPAGSDYASKAIHGPNDEVAVVLDGTEVGRVRVADLLP